MGDNKHHMSNSDVLQIIGSKMLFFFGNASDYVSTEYRSYNYNDCLN